MLRAYREDAAEVLPPRIYEQPNRIAELLVPPVPVPAAAADAAAGGDSTAERPGRGQATPGAPPGERVLRPGALQGGRVNQAAPPGRPGAVRGGRPAPGYFPPPGPDWSQPDPEGRGAVSTEDSVPPPSTTVVIRPGIQSTGRLELEVTPRGGRRGHGATGGWIASAPAAATGLRH
jgi:hypothetical protein